MNGFEIYHHTLPHANDIEQATDLHPTDLELLTVYDAVNGRAPYTPTLERAKRLLDNLAGSDCIAVLAPEANDRPRISAAASVRYEPEQNQTWIEGIATAPDYQGQGIGRELMTYIERQSAARGLALVALRSIPSAVTFYSKLGYDRRDLQAQTIHPVMEKPV